MNDRVDGESKAGKDFIRKVIEEDLSSGRIQKIVTRFPPEPNGFLHIGHAKSICLNFGLAKEYGGLCHLRFDDTDPTKEDLRYEEAIINDIHWLGFDWADKLFRASDYFDSLYEYAEQLILKGKAYVCDLNEEEIRIFRGTVLQPGKRSAHAERPIEEHLEIFRRMRQGEFPDNRYVLRAKIDMASSNMKMRDPLLYRIRHAHHYRTGDRWCIYPMYDYAHPISDALEGITHSICTLEFENNRELYDWFLDTIEAPFPSRPRQYEFARLDLENAVMSKRLILDLIQKGIVEEWDDRRLPTLSGLRRRGYTPEAIRNFCQLIGISKANSCVEQGQLDFCIRDHLNATAPRVFAVLRPLKLIIDNFPDDQTIWLEAPYWPDNTGLNHPLQKRFIPFTKELYIEEEDFQEIPEKNFYRLYPGNEVRLKFGFCIRCTHVDKDPASGKITTVHCTYDPQTQSGSSSSNRKVKSTLHWVSYHALRAKVSLYRALFKEGKEELNPQSKETLNALIELPFKEHSKELGPRFQFERIGYFYLDPEEERQEELHLHQIVSLKDSFKRKSSV